jgi:hypothetical protein
MCTALVEICRCAIRIVTINICGIGPQQLAFGTLIRRAPPLLIGASFQVFCDGASGVFAFDIRCRFLQNPAWRLIDF